MITKGDIVNGTFKLMRISGLTVSATPSETEDAIQVLDDYASELSVDLALPYIQPLEYGTSLPSDTSGLTPEMAGPVKKSFLGELCAYFGKEIPNSVLKTSSSGMRALENLLVEVDVAQNPATLPIGSGNEWDYRSNKFYSEPTSDEFPDNITKGDSFILPIDWSSWLQDQDLESVEYETDSGLVLSGETISTPYSNVKLTFNEDGYFELCATATKGISPDDEKFTQKYTYDVRDCKQPRLLNN